MRHNNSGKRLGRNTSQRLAMMRNMVTSLIQHEKITTTDTKAKELRKLAEKMVTLGKKNNLHARRQALRVVRDRNAVARLFDLLAPRYNNRAGGYTRIIKLGNRLGDNAPISRIEFVEELDPSSVKTKKAPQKVEPPQKAESTKEEVAAASDKEEVEASPEETLSGEAANKAEGEVDSGDETVKSGSSEPEPAVAKEKKEEQ